MYPVLSTTIPFAEGYKYGPSSHQDHIIVTDVTWITDIWPSDLESSVVRFCGGASFSVKGWATTVCSSVCVVEGAAFLRLLLFFLRGMLGGMLRYLLMG